MLRKLFSEDCYMLDIETDGLSPISNGMTSFCLMKFNINASSLRASVIDFIHFRINTAINVDMYRKKDIDTAKFRRESGIDEAESELDCLSSLESIPESINTFINATSNNNHNTRHIFALHTEFDIAFLRGYFEAAHYDFPFKHRNIWEISSMIRGMNEDLHQIRNEIIDTKLMESVAKQFHVENFNPHNAMYDCVRQIAFLKSGLIKSGSL